ncbi:MAG TPA: hypothetical protein VIE13_08310 [Terriglobales bacterium]|jgi:hypothetical protein
MSSPREAADPPRRPPAREAVVWVAEQRRLFQRVLDALGRGHIPFAVAGAFAFQHYTGIARGTKDLDLFLPAVEIGAALERCRAAGLETEITDPVWLAKVHAGEYYVDLITGMSNGVYWVTPEWVERARRGPVLEGSYPLLAPEEMILSKIFVTRRERFDGADICHLVYCCGRELDWPRLLREVGEQTPMLFWHLLLFQYVYPAAVDRVPRAVWRQLRREQQAGLEHPPAAGFRGSLVDPLQFAADVQEWGLENRENELRRRRLRA